MSNAQTLALLKQLTQQAPEVSPLGSQAFGAQSLWSSLLVERERLESEIKHAQLFLQQLRRDLDSSKPVSSAKPFRGRRSSAHHKRGAVRTALDRHTLEQSLLMWLNGLHARLTRINEEAEKLLAQGEPQPESPEEALFILLRGAR